MIPRKNFRSPPTALFVQVFVLKVAFADSLKAVIHEILDAGLLSSQSS
jgi:hypothetical protein